MRQAVAVGGVHYLVNDVVHILLHRVVHAALAAGRAGAVVIDAQSAARIDEIDGETHLVHLHVELRRLAYGGLDVAYVGHLTAYVEMNEFQAVAQPFGRKHLQRLQQLARREAELAGVAAAVLPLAAARRTQLDADADVGAQVETLGDVGYEVELVHLLYYQIDTLAHLVGQQRQLDIALVLVAVADDERIALGVHRDDGVQLGFRTRLQTEVELLAVAYYLLHHGVHLVHLDGIYRETLAAEPVFLGSLAVAARHTLDAVVENIGEAQQHGSADVAQRQFVHHLAQIDLDTVLLGCDDHVPLIVYAEVRDSPAVDVVKIGRIFNVPFFHSRNSFRYGLIDIKIPFRGSAAAEYAIPLQNICKDIKFCKKRARIRI